MTEIWKPLLFNEQETGYEISSFGSIRDCTNHELQDDKFKSYQGDSIFNLKFGNTRYVKIHKNNDKIFVYWV